MTPTVRGRPLGARAARAATRNAQTAPSSGGEGGFTIIELLVTLAILGILAALAILNMGAAIEKARVGRAIAEIRSIEKEVAKYELDEGELPPSLDEIGWGTRADPWGYTYRYLSFATVGKGLPGKARKDKKLVPLNSSYDLYSVGPDGKSKSPLTAKHSWDDIVRAGDGAFVGRATDF